MHDWHETWTDQGSANYPASVRETLPAHGSVDSAVTFAQTLHAPGERLSTEARSSITEALAGSARNSDREQSRIYRERSRSGQGYQGNGSDTDSSAAVSLAQSSLAPRWNASPRIAHATMREQKHVRARRSSARRQKPLQNQSPGTDPFAKSLTPSRTKKLRASEKFVQAAEATAGQAVSVILQSLPKLRHMIRDLGCAPREG